LPPMLSVSFCYVLVDILNSEHIPCVLRVVCEPFIVAYEKKRVSMIMTGAATDYRKLSREKCEKLCV
jgi:hypothetical protein